MPPIERWRSTWQGLGIGQVDDPLWFHDAVYDVHRHDNEEQSARLMRAAAARVGLPAPESERVSGLIMATKHDAVPAGVDAALIVDVDLSILGAAVERFDDERQVRDEYSWVPGFIFRRRRRQH